MATRYVKEATKQLNPVYAQSQQAIQSQIPAIQNLYQTLNQGLQTSYDTQLNSGVQGIVEDASARGVLRSTLPVDARQALTTQLSQALLQGQGELGARQAGDLSGIQERLGALNIQRAGSIADLARALETQDLDRSKFSWQKKMDIKQLALARAQAAARGGGGGGNTPQWQLNQQALGIVAGKWKPGGDGYVNPKQWNALRSDWQRAGFSASSFDSQFSDLINPAHFQYSNLPQYKVGSSIAKQFK